MTSVQLSAVGTWAARQLEFAAGNAYHNPYTDVEFWVGFRHEDGTVGNGTRT